MSHTRSLLSWSFHSSSGDGQERSEQIDTKLVVASDGCHSLTKRRYTIMTVYMCACVCVCTVDGALHGKHRGVSEELTSEEGLTDLKGKGQIGVLRNGGKPGCWAERAGGWCRRGGGQSGTRSCRAWQTRARLLGIL